MKYKEKLIFIIACTSIISHVVAEEYDTLRISDFGLNSNSRVNAVLFVKKALKLAKEVEALSNVIATSTTGKKNFLKRWNLLKRWIILVPVPERKKHLFSYAKIVNTKILYFSSAPKACKELDAYIEKAGRYLRTRTE